MNRKFVIGRPDKEHAYALLVACRMVHLVERHEDIATLELCAVKNTMGITRVTSGVCRFHDYLDLNQVLIDAVDEILPGETELDLGDADVVRFLSKVQDTFYTIVEGHFRC